MKPKSSLTEIFLGTILLFVLGMVTTIFAQSKQSERSTSSSACTPIAYGQSLDGTIAIAGEEDCFEFNGTAGHLINVFLDHQASVFAYFSLRLTASNGASWFCDFRNSDCEIDTLTLPITGVYTITIDGRGDATGNYRLCLNRINEPPESIVYDQALDRDISPPGDQDNFTFAGLTGQRVTVFLDHRASVFSYFSLRLSRPDGRSLVYCDFRNSDCEIDTVTLPTTGIYTINVDGRGDGNGPYTLIVNLVPGITETISYDQCFDRDISPMGDQDRFIFSGNVGQQVNIFLDHRASVFSYFSLRLVKPDGKALAFCDFKNSDCEIDTLTLPMTGVYSITVDGRGDANGAYSLCLNLLPGTIEPISYGQSLTRAISPMGDQDSFSFCGVAGKQVTAFLDHQASVFSYFSLRLIQPDGKTLAYCDFKNSDCEIGRVTLPMAGQYFLAVDGRGDATGNYALSLSCHTAPCECVANCPTVSDVNPKIGVIGIPVTITGNNFIGVTAVKFFNNIPAVIKSKTNTQIVTEVPSGAITGQISLVAPNCVDAKTSTFTVCTYTISPISKTFLASGDTGTVKVRAEAGCTWTASSKANWITITSGSSGNSNGTVNYRVNANSNANARTDTLIIAGQKFVVIQAGGGIPIVPIVSSPQLTGQEFWVEVKVGDNANPVMNLFGVSFCLTFTRTDLIDVVTPYSSNVSAGPFLGSDVVFQSNVDETAGKVCIGVSRKTGQVGVSGSGIVARVKFVARSSTPNGTSVQFCTAEVIANDPSGNSISLTPSCVNVTINSCLTVWPGDTNNDGKVDQADVLPLGLYWSRTGSACQTPPNCAWAARCCAVWATTALTYADANGDGVVNQADVLCLGLNWGKTHSTIIAKANHQTGTLRTEQNPMIEPEVNPAQAPNQEFFLRIKISEVTNLFGLSFELLYDQMPLMKILAIESDSLLGSDVVFYSTVDTLNGKIAVGISRKAGQSGSSGTGSIVRVRAKISGKANDGTKISFALQNVIANDANGAPLNLTPRSASTTVLRTAIASEREMALPAEYWLGQNYPNPFNPTTKIAFSIISAGHVTLKVYDILGKEIATLVDQHLIIGRHEAIWDASGVESGVYFYQLRASEFVATRKLILMK